MKPYLLLGILFVLLLASKSIAQDVSRFEDEVKQIALRDFQRNDQKTFILFTGSSSVRLWSNLQTGFPEVQILNTGFGGSTMEELLHYSDQLIFKYQPEKIFIYEGDNDIVLGHTTERIMKATETLLAKIQCQLPNTKVFIIAAKPSVARWEHHAAYIDLNHSYMKLAKLQRKVKYIDIWNPMLGDDGKPMPDIFIEDNLHMNSKGYSIWATEMQKHIK